MAGLDLSSFGILSLEMVFLHGTSIFFAVMLSIFAPKVLSIAREDAPPAIQVLAVRLCLAAYLTFEVVDIVLLHSVHEYDRPLYRGALSILTIVAGVILCNIFNRWSRKRFGAEKAIDGCSEIVATYYSRLTGILFSVVISIKVMYLLVKIWEMNSLLETTGFVGLIAAFLVFTNSIWLPDLYFGLVILNSDMFGDGDAVRFSDEGPIYVISRVSLIYTTLLNIENNNRAVLRNSKILENKIENLTKRASVEGLRQSLSFKVSYPHFSRVDGSLPEKESQLRTEVERFYNRLNEMFTKADEQVQKDCNGSIANNSKFDWGIINAGDYALEVNLHYYLAPLPATKLTKKLRTCLYETRKQVIHAVYTQSIIYDIELSTPTMINIDNTRKISKSTQENIKEAGS